MNRIMTGMASLALLSMLWAHSAAAQPADPPSFVPVEIYTCMYNKGKGDKDLQRAIDKWNKWADENSKTPYSAWVITPAFHGPGNNFDVGWLGAWPDGKAMGASLAKWMSDGGALSAEFDKVMDCGTHSNFASTAIRAPAEGWPGESGLVVFTDCNVAEGKTIPDAMAAHNAWAKHLDGIGSKAGMWAFFPGFGNLNDDGEVPFDYKVVSSQPDFNALGADWENYTNGQGWSKGQELTRGVVECNSPRVYTSRTVRNGNFAPN